jgi:hypothetical protein
MVVWHYIDIQPLYQNWQTMYLTMQEVMKLKIPAYVFGLIIIAIVAIIVL